MKKNIPSDEELKKYSHKKMTMPLLEHASDETKEQVWKLQVFATDDEYVDSYSLLGCGDGQEALESLIELRKTE